MDEQTLARATEPFFTTKGVGSGTGLGLSMAHGFAEQSGGHFIIRSQKNEGTTAELWLPTAVADIADGEETGGEETGGEETVSARTPNQVQRRAEGTHPLVILVVDDDRLGLMNTTTTLNNLGHKVYTSASGKQALDTIRREDGINLVIIDHALPDMTGAELTEAIRMDWPTLPIIYATPLADTSLQQVAKPIRDEELLKAVARVPPVSARAMR